MCVIGISGVDDAALTRGEALDLLAVIEDASEHVQTSRLYALVLALQDAARILADKLFPDLPTHPEE